MRDSDSDGEAIEAMLLDIPQSTYILKSLMLQLVKIGLRFLL